MRISFNFSRSVENIYFRNHSSYGMCWTFQVLFPFLNPIINSADPTKNMTVLLEDIWDGFLLPFVSLSGSFPDTQYSFWHLNRVCDSITLSYVCSGDVRVYVCILSLHSRQYTGLTATMLPTHTNCTHVSHETVSTQKPMTRRGRALPYFSTKSWVIKISYPGVLNYMLPRCQQQVWICVPPNAQHSVPITTLGFFRHYLVPSPALLLKLALRLASASSGRGTQARQYETQWNGSCCRRK